LFSLSLTLSLFLYRFLTFHLSLYFVSQILNPNRPANVESERNILRYQYIVLILLLENAFAAAKNAS
jgi:hypothetical protein